MSNHARAFVTIVKRSFSTDEQEELSKILQLEVVARQQKRRKNHNLLVSTCVRSTIKNRSEARTQWRAFLNYDVIAEVARFVGVFGRSSSSFALVSKGWYQALVSLFEDWKEYQRGFGLPRSVWISESSDDCTFNHRAAVVDSLKKAAKGDRSCILMEPELYVDDFPGNRTALALITIARTSHLRSEKFSALWKALMQFLVEQVNVAFLSVLPLAGSSSEILHGTSIEDNFLSRTRSLTSVALASMGSVTTIGSGFLSSCNLLTTVDLGGLSSVTSVGAFFLSDCVSLTTLDLAGMSSVTTIGRAFASRCYALTSVNLAGLSSVTAIGDYFLNYCTSLITVNFADLSSVTTIGSAFLTCCSLLTSVDLTGLSSVADVGNGFFLGCSALTSVNLSGLSSLTTIGDGFLQGCPLTDSAEMDKQLLIERTGNQSRASYQPYW